MFGQDVPCKEIALAEVRAASGHEGAHDGCVIIRVYGSGTCGVLDDTMRNKGTFYLTDDTGMLIKKWNIAERFSPRAVSCRCRF